MYRLLVVLFTLFVCVYPVRAAENLDCCTHLEISECSQRFIVQDVRIISTEWETFPDGTPPEVISYEMEIELNNKQSYYACLDREDTKILLPFKFIHPGDEIEIKCEGYILHRENRSWFRFCHTATGIEFDAEGASMKPKTVVPPGVAVSRVHDLQYDTPFCVSFKIGNLYFRAPIKPGKYHGFYEGMPFVVQGYTVNEQDQFGRFNYLLFVSTLEKQQHLCFKSIDYFSEDAVEVRIARLEACDIKSHGHSFYPEMYSFQLKITLEDGTQYTTKKRCRIAAAALPPKEAVEAFLREKHRALGHTFVILDERPHSKDGRRSDFTFTSLREGTLLEIEGPARSIEPHIQPET